MNLKRSGSYSEVSSWRDLAPAGSKPFDGPINQLHFQVIVGRREFVQRTGQVLFVNSPFIGESDEAELAVGLADAAVVAATEGQVGIEEMNGVVVDASAASPGGPQYTIDVLLAFAVNIKPKRLFL